jgi:hypothetical protein
LVDLTTEVIENGAFSIKYHYISDDPDFSEHRMQARMKIVEAWSGLRTLAYSDTMIWAIDYMLGHFDLAICFQALQSVGSGMTFANGGWEVYQSTQTNHAP